MVDIRIKNLASALILLTPFLVLYTIFTIYPLAVAIHLSLYRTTPYGDYYVGLDNYVSILTGKDIRLNIGFSNVLVYGLFNAITLGLSLLVAWLLTRSITGKWSTVTQIVILLPMVVSWVSLGLAWTTLLSAIRNLGRAAGVMWLDNPLVYTSTAKWTVGALITWGSLGYATLLYISTIRSLPMDYFEAAMIDGASDWQIFRHVTVPLLKHIIIFQLIGAVVAAFNIFDPVAVLTGGGPAWSSTSVAYYAARQVQYAWNVGMCAAIGVVVIAIVLGLNLFQFRLIYKRLV
ncbi:MAG: sugar ABC transporter permease [Desulfurococcaceae archaeon]